MRGGRRKTKTKQISHEGERSTDLRHISVSARSVLCGLGAVQEEEGVQDGKRTFS